MLKLEYGIGIRFGEMRVRVGIKGWGELALKLRLGRVGIRSGEG